jgi:hypothetical protein
VTLELWAQQVKLNADSITTQQLFACRTMSVQEYVSRFRKGRLREVLPTEALSMSVEVALQQRMVGGVNLRKLLTAQREKFQK